MVQPADYKFWNVSATGFRVESIIVGRDIRSSPGV